MRDTEPPRVVVADIGTDAALYSEPGNRVLVLRPGQTFSNAVAAAQRCLPNAHPDVIRTVVRTYLPDAPDFDLPSVPPLMRTEPVPARTPVQPRWFMSRAVMIGILCVATALSLGGWGLVGIGTDEPPVAASQTGTTTTNVRQAGMEPYKNEAFRDFAKRGELTCDPMANAMRASCTDWEGSVMVSEATIGADRIIFTFQYGKDRVSLGIFTKPDDATTWAKVNQDREGVRVEGRFVLWGTDKGKLDAYKKLLAEVQPPRQTGAVVPSADHPEHNASATSAELDVRGAARSLAELLPRQLGAIVMGTLGVTSEAVDRAGRLGIEQALSPPVAIAVRLALGVPPPPESGPPGGASDEDILTIANEPLPVPNDQKPAPKGPAPDPAPPSDPAPDPAPPSDPAPDPEPAPPPSDPAPPPADPVPPPSDPAPPPADPEPSPQPSPSDPDPSPSPGPGTEDDGGDPVPSPNDDGSEKGPTTDEGVPTETGDPTTPPGDSGGNGDSKTETEWDKTKPVPGLPEPPEQPAPGPEEQPAPAPAPAPEEHAEDDGGENSGPGDESTVPTDDEQDSGDQSDDDCTKHDDPDEHGESAPADAAQG
ncbi:hypothetical protein [Tenggerimyces flavus]|uniref:Uncharacterized protein n=1 Tax=Tenggerimyces flavus TaxID=1708749 RepID=A0ABV7YLS3_9ACTN|nr:hypothetical protein [Tenggerimyces flavus]MBM7784829.1 hypothetical protein [Tenggerimyces flavus]